MMKPDKINNENGIVLVTGLMCLLLLMILGATAYLLSTTDVFISANYKATEQAFNDAEAGVEFAEALIEAHLRSESYLSGTTDYLPNPGPEDIPGADDIPDGFSFELSQMQKIATNLYTFVSTGHAPRNAIANIEATFRRRSAYDYAIFAQNQIDMKNSTGVFSYNSLISTHPLPGPGFSPWDTTSTVDTDSNGVMDLDETYSLHHGDIGVNGDGDAFKDIILDTNTWVDGDISKGQTGDPPTKAATDPADPSGHTSGTSEDLGYEEPIDPEGIGDDTEWDNKFPTYAATNNNGAIAGLGDYVLDASDGDVVIDQPGDYYFTDITLANGQTLTVDTETAGGAINIWVVGKVEGKNGSEFDVRTTPSGNDFSLNVTEPFGGCGCSTIIDLKNSGDFAPNSTPTDVNIRTDSDKTVSIHNGNDTRAVIYAPFADVDFDNGAAFYGAVRGKTVTLRNSMKVYYDEAIKNGGLLNEIEFTAWRQVLN